MKNRVVKITIEGADSGKYKFYATAGQLLALMNNSELFMNHFIDAKTGEEIIHKDKVLFALNSTEEFINNNQC